jgi:hypothetical protein
MEALRDFVVRVVPRDSFKNLSSVLRFADAASLGRDATHGIEHAIGRVHTIEIFRNLCAQKSASHRMRRIAAQFGRAPDIINSDQYSTRIGTIV